MNNFDIFELPDLVSRLRNVNRVYIDNPGQELIKVLLIKGFAKKQLKIDYKIIDYLTKNITRSYKSVSQIIVKIEKFCFENRKTVSINDVKSMIS